MVLGVLSYLCPPLPANLPFPCKTPSSLRMDAPTVPSLETANPLKSGDAKPWACRDPSRTAIGRQATERFDSQHRGWARASDCRANGLDSANSVASNEGQNLCVLSFNRRLTS